MDAESASIEFIEALRRALESISVSTSDRLVFQGELARFGWDIALTDAEFANVREHLNIEAALESLGALSEGLENGTADELETIGQLLAAIYAIINNVRTLGGAGIGALPPPLNTSTFWDEFREDLINELLSRTFEEELAVLFRTLVLFGFFDEESATPAGPQRLPFRRPLVNWHLLGDIVTDPVGSLKLSVGWGTNLRYEKLLEGLDTFAGAAGFSPRIQLPPTALLDTYYSPANPARPAIRELVVPFLVEFDDGFADFAELGIRVIPITPAGNTNAEPVGMAIGPVVRGAVQGDLDESGDGDRWLLALTADQVPDGAFLIELRPDDARLAINTGASSVDFGLSLRGQFSSPKSLIGAENSHRLEVEGVFVALDIKGTPNSPELILKAGTGEGPKPPRIRFVFQASEGDGFLTDIVGTGPQTIDWGGHFSLSSKHGLGFNGSVGLEFQFPLHLLLGPIEITSISIAATASTAGDLKIPIGVDIKANLGPLVAVVENIGAKMTLEPADSGDSGLLGDRDVVWGFKPPNGVGLSIDAGAVKGGGYLFFDFDREEYAGDLELVFSEWITLKAIGLITTKMPDGSKGFSLLVIITAEFGTGFQLGFGFTLDGVGGILGLNRIVNIDPLKDGVRTGAVESVMFPENLVANAPRIISDLRQFFPPRQDIFLVGPMAKIGWGTPTLVTVTLGVILEFPNVDITILGVIKVVLPDEEADVLRLQVNFIGRLEPSNKLLWFYAELFDSRVLFITLEGGFGLLVNWGDNANFVVSAGGFHPRYDPPPLPFPEPPRIAVNILNESYAKIRIEAYFAVTSNSVQFGARVELFFGVSAFNIDGHLAFDALFMFDPFFFSFGLSISLSVKVFGVGMFSVGFSGLLEGPTPWHIEGKGKISLFFFKISVPFKHAWGDNQDTKLDPIEIFPLLEAELNALTNWEARLPVSSNLLVSLRKMGETETDQLVLHPVGKLRVSQRKIPINFTLDKFGNNRPSDVNKIDVGAELSGVGSLSVSSVEDKFAIGQFKDLDGSKQLSSPGFELLESGIEIATAGEQMKTSRAVRRVIRYESIIFDSNYKRHVKRFFGFFATGYAILNDFLFTHFLTGNSATQSVHSQHHKNRMQPFDEVIEVKPNLYSVASTADNRPLNTATTVFTSQAKAQQHMEQQIRAGIVSGSDVHVVPNTELNLAA